MKPHPTPPQIPSILKSLAVFAAVIAMSSAPAFAQKSPPRPRLGTNLNGPVDYNTEIPFVDIFRLSRSWISQREGEGWGKGPALDLDENGWIKSLEPGCFAETPLLTTGGHAPVGTYTLLYEGEGEIRLNAGTNMGLRVEPDEGGKILFDLSPEPEQGDSSLFLQIRATDQQNPIRNIRVILPGHAETYNKEPFRPGFLDLWRGMACFRFMDWQKTNNSKQKHWEDRPTLQSATWTRDGGIPIEVMVDFSNRMKADPWFCMPHQADDEYVRNFAMLVKEKLDPSLIVYVEYSNEVWNSIFSQNKYAGEKGVELGLGSKERPWEAGWAYYGKRSVEIFKIWEEVFGGKGRLVRVIASQSANTHVGRQILEAADAKNNADAFAIAPYVSLNLPKQSERADKLTADEVAEWNVDQVMQEMLGNRLPLAIEDFYKNKALADEYGLQLIAYEAGQHAVGIQGGENNSKLVELLQEANRSKAMGDLYAKYLRAWSEAGGDLIVNFTSIARWGKWGSWGLMQYYDDKPGDYPKFFETMRWAKEVGQPVNVD